MEKRTHQFVLYMHKVGALSLKITFNFCFCTMMGPSKISARPRFIKIHGKRQRCQMYIADQTLIDSSEALENSRGGEINIHGERDGCQTYKADQPLTDNSLAPKTLRQSHPRHGVLHFDQVVANHIQHLSMQGCDDERSGGGGVVLVGVGGSGNGGRCCCCCYCCCC